MPFEASLVVAEDGRISWQTAGLRQDDKEAAFEMFTAGRKPAEVAPELGAHRATVYRWHKEWKGGASD
jgi:hypothetical protein